MDKSGGKQKKAKGKGRARAIRSGDRTADSSPNASPESGSGSGSQRRGRGRPRGTTNLNRGILGAGLFATSPNAGTSAAPQVILTPEQMGRIQKGLHEMTFAKNPQLQYENKEILTFPTPFNCCQEDQIKGRLHQKMEMGNIATRDGFVTICEEIAYEMERQRGKEVKMSHVMIKIVQWRARFKRFMEFVSQPDIQYYENGNIVRPTEEYIQNKIPVETEEEMNFRKNGLEDYTLFANLFIHKSAALLPNEPSTNYIDPRAYDLRF